ncbi:MAG: hypothetical protein HQL22_06570 [Candidatus Omnitrophica bacterium]|nr:hypothetical protein [Candidatus Omnitrophota bacterium]
MRDCPRTIDKPLLILGLEGEDIAVLMLLFGIPAVLIQPAIPLMLLFAAWPGLAFLKRGKPEGYMIHLLYRLGVPFDGLLPLREGRYAVYEQQGGLDGK